MSGNVKYRLEAYSAKYKDLYRVDIHEDGYAGEPIKKNIGAGKIVLSKSDGVIQKTTLSISIQSDTSFEYLGFFDYDNRKYLVILYKNNTAIWTGYQVAESYSEPYQNPPYDVVISATDNLGFLENYTFNNEELPGRLATEKYLTRLEAIDGCINNIGITLNYEIAVDFYEESMDTNYASIAQAQFLATIFNGENCKDVVESLLPYGTVLTQHNNRWLIRRPLDDSEKTHTIYTFSGDYFGTNSGETLLTMGDYSTRGIWPHGMPLLEMEHAWRKAQIKADYGKRESFLQNSNFAEGSEYWDDFTDGNFSVKKPVMRRPGEEPSFNFYYGYIEGYCPVSTNHYVEHTEDIEQTTDDFIFEMEFDALAYRRYRGVTSSIEITVNLSISIGSYYLSLDYGWAMEPSLIEVKIRSTTGYLPDWKKLRILASQVPVAGEISVKIYRIKYNDLSDLNTIRGLAFSNINVFTDALIESPDSETFDVSLRENAVEGSNSFTLKPVNTPIVDNQKYIFENSNFVGSELEGNWSDNGQTAVSYIQAIANKMASYHKFVRHRISGCEWRGEGMSLNAIALHPKNARRKFVVESGSWNILDDTFNVVWVEVGKTDTATLTATGSSAPSASNSGSGVTPNTGTGHPPVTIATGSEAYLSIDDDQELSFTPEDYHWFIHTPEQVIETLDEPSGFQETVDGGNAVIEQISANTYTVTALNANGETTGAGTPSYLLDIHEDTTQALFEWTAVPGATGYRVYKAGQYMETINPSFDHLTWTAEGAGTPPAENTATITQNAFRIDKADTVQFFGEHIDIETAATGATKTVTFTGHPEVTIATGSAAYLSISSEQELSLTLSGLDGDDAYVYIAYASDDAGTDFTLTFNPALDYIAILATDTEIPSPDVGDFAGLWKKYKGDQGTQGDQGDQGEQGDQGLRGYQGYQGNQGEQGEQGATGETGSQGVQGHQGERGFQGFQGVTGAQGSTGAQGVQGQKGDRGFQGYQGETGHAEEWLSGLDDPLGTQGDIGDWYINITTNDLFEKTDSSTWTLRTNIKGEQGYQGVRGYQGYQGEKGEQGNQGHQGVQGAKGFQGEIGETGAQGSQGHQGATGPQGDQGETGPQGLTGAKGDQGEQGATGAQGLQGETGPQGLRGFQGYQGDKGLKGDKGEQGVQGLTGAKGDQGAQGARGFQGHQGLQGEQGDAGPQGLKGDKGDTGPQGVQGAKGDIGDQGPRGYQGYQGNQGLRGYQGVKGDTGNAGPQGPQGPQGLRGYQGYQGDQGETGDSYWSSGTYGIHRIGRVGIGANAASSSQLYTFGTISGGWAASFENNISTGNGVFIYSGATTSSHKVLSATSNAGSLFNVLANGQIQLNKYGGTGFTGTASKWLAVDSTGNIIQQTPPAEGRWESWNGALRPIGYTTGILVDENVSYGMNLYYSSGWKRMTEGYASCLKQETFGVVRFNLGSQGAAGGSPTFKYIDFNNDTGTITAANFILNSMRKLKKWIKNIIKPERFDLIKIKQFVFKNDETERIRYGVIAEDIEKIAPELVYTDLTGQKTVAYIDLAMAKIARLEQRLKKLESKYK